MCRAIVRSVLLSGLAAAALAAPALRAQAPTRGAFVVMLGRDTIAVEQYTRSGNRLEGDLLARTPRTGITHYVVTLNPDGTPRGMELTARRPDGTPVPDGLRSATVAYSRDSVTTTITADSARTLRAAIADAFPLMNNSFAFYELWLARARATHTDTAVANLVGLGARAASPYGFRMLGGDSVRVWYFGSPQYLLVDRAGMIRSLDGSLTTNKIMVTRVAAVDIPALAARFAAADAAGHGFGGPASPRDTARATIGTATVWVDYGRPALRGRDVWAKGVLGDTIWRTGANEATQFGTSADLVVNGTTIPAGTYTLWTHAAPNGTYELIFNTQTGQWGTVYRADRDLLRVPLQVGGAPPTDRFTITIVPSGNAGGTLHLAWGTRTLSLPFTLK